MTAEIARNSSFDRRLYRQVWHKIFSCKSVVIIRQLLVSHCTQQSFLFRFPRSQFSSVQLDVVSLQAYTSHGVADRISIGSDRAHRHRQGKTACRHGGETHRFLTLVPGARPFGLID